MRRVGLVGFGSIAENGHLPAWQALPDVQVTAFADVSSQRLERARSMVPDASYFNAPLELISHADIDILDICTPPSTHADLIVAACQRGIADIVCEKPLVLTEDEYERIDAARAKSGSRVVSVNNWTHSELNQHVLSLIRSGAIGKVREVELRTGRTDAAMGNAGWNPAWRTDRAYSGGGIILDHGWHQIYLLMGWIGEPVISVGACMRVVNPKNFPVEDEAEISLQFTSGRGRIDLSWTAPGRSNGGVVRGTTGELGIDDDRVVLHNGRNIEERIFGERLTQSSYHPEWFGAMFQRNILTVDREEADRNFAEAGVLVKVIAAAYRSASENGAPQHLSATSGRESGNRSGEGIGKKDVCMRAGGTPT